MKRALIIAMLAGAFMTALTGDVAAQTARNNAAQPRPNRL